MKINSITHKSSNKYIVNIENEKYTLYDDVVLKYGLYNKKEIDDKTLNLINEEQNYYTAYYKIISFISYKMRTEKEVVNKLKSYHLGKSMINKIVNQLKENNYLNSDKYLSSYFNDQINLSLKGPNKIKKELKLIGYQDDEIDNLIDNISDDEWIIRINKIIEKKIKANHTLSCKMFNIKMKSELIQMGYTEHLINQVGTFEFDDSIIREKIYDKLKKTYQKKYQDEKLDMIIKQKMYQLGFVID